MDKSRLLEAIRQGCIDPFWAALYHKDSPAPPAAPDYTAAAQAQGAANVETARAQGRMNNPNVTTPYGSQTVTWGSGTPTFDETGYNRAQADYQTALNAYQNRAAPQMDSEGNPLPSSGGGSTGTAPVAPNRDAFTTIQNADQPTITQTLAPAQQALLDAQNRISGNLAGVAESGLNRVSAGFNTPFDTSGLPQQVNNVGNGQYQSSVNAPQLQSGYDQGGKPQYSTGYNQPIQNQIAGAGNIQNSYQNGGQVRYNANPSGQIQTGYDSAGQQQGNLQDVGQAQRGLDFSGAPQLPGTNDFSADRDAVTNAMLSRSEPQFQRDEDLTRTRLMNQGIAPGAEASNYDLDTLNRARNDARQQAILAGGQEQSRLFGLASQARAQSTGETAQQGNFANSAQSQAFNQGLAGGNFANAAQAAQNAQNQSAAQFGNQAQAQGFGQNQADLAAYNAAQAQATGQAQQAAQFGNAAQGQQFSQNQAGGEFANSAQNQGYNQAQGNMSAYNAAQGQANTQNQQAAQFGNTAAQNQFGMGQQNATLNNQAAQQMFSQGLANANLTNQGRQQSIQEQAYLRSLPLNELNALRTGSQVQSPQFQPYQGSTIGQTPVFQAAQAQNQYNMGLASNEQAASNNQTAGMVGLASAAAMAF